MLEKNSQYSRRECLEVVGTLHDASSKNLESTALDKLLKREIGITLSLQNKVGAYSIANICALKEICKFNKCFVKLESKIKRVKQTRI